MTREQTIDGIVAFEANPNKQAVMRPLLAKLDGGALAQMLDGLSRMAKTGGTRNPQVLAFLEALASSGSREQRLETALREVMGWIANWDPSFVHDDEWPATRERVEKALKRE